VVLDEKKNFDLQTVKIVKLGGVKEGGGGEKNFFFSTDFDQSVVQDEKKILIFRL
jgi:hypothetical protein